MSRKRVLITVVAAGAVIVTAWLLSPIWRSKSLDEPLPTNSALIKDNLDSMDAATKKAFMQATDDMQKKSVSVSDAMPGGPVVLSEADFQSGAHQVAGRAKLLQTGGQKVLRFEKFKTINGPDLRVYLSAGLNNKDYIDLGAIKATEGNINYLVPSVIDTAKYHDVLIWCRSFSVLFSYAELTSK